MTDRGKWTEGIRGGGVALLLLVAILGSAVLGLSASLAIVRQGLPPTAPAVLRIFVVFGVLYFAWAASLVFIACVGAALADAAIPVQRRRVPSYLRWVLGIARREGPWYLGTTAIVALLAAAGIASHSASFLVCAVTTAAILAVLASQKAALRRRARGS